MKLNEDILSLIGNTPLVKIRKMAGENSAEIWAKLEGFNPGGSVKDRIALSMIESAEKEGALFKGVRLSNPRVEIPASGLQWFQRSRDTD